MLTIDSSNTQFLFNLRYNTSPLYLKELFITLRGDMTALRLDGRGDLRDNLGRLLFDSIVRHINDFSGLLANAPFDINHVLVFNEFLIGIIRR
jgi:hypothetical protein